MEEVSLEVVGVAEVVSVVEGEGLVDQRGDYWCRDDGLDNRHAVVYLVEVRV